MTKNTITFELLRFLFYQGQTRSLDVSRYLNYKYINTRTASTTYKRLLEKEYISEFYYTNKHAPKGKDRVTIITQAGIDYIKGLSKNINSDYLSGNYKREYIKKYEEENERVNKLLTDNGILINFYALGVPALKRDKPSLPYLTSSLLNYQKVTLDSYNETLGVDACIELVNRGVFYTLNEFREFSKSIGRGREDTYWGTRARGIFFSNKTALVIYSSKRYDNKIIKVNYMSEYHLLDEVHECLSAITDVYRKITKLCTNNYSYYNNHYALLFSDGDLLAYSTATGNAKGKSKGQDNIDSVSQFERNLSDSPKASTYLTPGSKLFEKLYVVPFTQAGLLSLEYLTSNSTEETIKDGRDLIESIPCFKKMETSAAPFPYYHINNSDINSVTFMPVFEANEIYHLSRTEGTPAIVTYRDLLNMISHSVKKNCEFYDGNNLSKFSICDYTIYDKRGDIAGEGIVKAELKKRGLAVLNSSEYNRVPKELGYSKILFYNQIFSGELSLDFVLPLFRTKEYIPKEKQYRSKEYISLAVSKELKNKICDLAKDQALPLSTYIKEMLKNV